MDYKVIIEDLPFYDHAGIDSTLTQTIHTESEIVVNILSHVRDLPMSDSFHLNEAWVVL